MSSSNNGLARSLHSRYNSVTLSLNSGIRVKLLFVRHKRILLAWEIGGTWPYLCTPRREHGNNVEEQVIPILSGTIRPPPNHLMSRTQREWLQALNPSTTSLVPVPVPETYRYLQCFSLDASPHKKSPHHPLFTHLLWLECSCVQIINEAFPLMAFTLF